MFRRALVRGAIELGQTINHSHRLYGLLAQLDRYLHRRRMRFALYRADLTRADVPLFVEVNFNLKAEFGDVGDEVRRADLTNQRRGDDDVAFQILAQKHVLTAFLRVLCGELTRITMFSHLAARLGGEQSKAFGDVVDVFVLHRRCEQSMDDNIRISSYG